MSKTVPCPCDVNKHISTQQLTTPTLTREQSCQPPDRTAGPRATPSRLPVRQPRATTRVEAPEVQKLRNIYLLGSQAIFPLFWGPSQAIQPATHLYQIPPLMKVRHFIFSLASELPKANETHVGTLFLLT